MGELGRAFLYDWMVALGTGAEAEQTEAASGVAEQKKKKKKEDSSFP